LIEEFGFKSFIYEPGNEFITDQPSCITTVKYSDGETKEIDHYYGHIFIDNSMTAFEKKIERIIGTKKYVNPRLYIYQVEEKVPESPIKYIVVSDSEKEAIDLVEKEYIKSEPLKWWVQKIGIATDDYYGPNNYERRLIADNNRLKGTQYGFPVHCSGFANNIKITDSNRMGVIINEPIFFHFIEFTRKRSSLNP